MLDLLIILISISVLVSGILAVTLRNVVAAAVSGGLASLSASVIFILLAAPDVAMAEAAIGSGLATFILLYTIHKTGARKV